MITQTLNFSPGALTLVLALFVCLPAAAEVTATLLPADPPSTRTLDLEEVWRRGGEDDEDILLGVVRRAKMDVTGNTYLLDSQLSTVHVIDLHGEVAGTLGREGDGPGEMRRPNDVFLMDDGQIGIAQGFPGKIIVLNADDTPGGSINIGEAPEEGGFFFMGESQMRGGNLMVHAGRGTFDTSTSKNTTTQFLSLVTQDGQEITRFVEHVRVRDFTRQEYNEKKDFSELSTWALGDDVVYTAPVRDEYVIHARDLEGNVVAVFRRDFAPRKRSQEDKDEMTSNMRIVINGQEQEMEKHVLDHDPAIMSLEVARDGRIFVSNCFHQRKLMGEGLARQIDVLAPDGQFLEELTLRVPGFNIEQDRLMFLDGEHWLLIKNLDSASDAMNAGFGDVDEEEDLTEVEPLEVVLYRIP